MKSISLLGSTGSIGTQTLDVVAANAAQFSIYALSGHSNTRLLAEQCRKFSPKVVVVPQAEQEVELRQFGVTCEILVGPEALIAIASAADADIVVGAIVGFACLPPVLAAIENGKSIAIANKECFVAAGELVMSKLRASTSRIVPIDSEHSSIFQCLGGRTVPSQVSRIVLTASGGPFLRMGADELKKVTPEQAVKHPRWAMGAKISVDSANLMNKGLEVIEAAWLFDLPAEKVGVLIHPQSIVHGLVEFEDKAVIACMFETDMRQPISFALGFLSGEPGPRLGSNCVSPLDLSRWERLEFIQADHGRYPALQLCYQALRAGGTAPAVLNAANEVAVEAFLEKRIGFVDITAAVEDTVSKYSNRPVGGASDVFEADHWGRVTCGQILDCKTK